MACTQGRTMVRSLTPFSRARGTRHTRSRDSKVLGEANGRRARRAVGSALALVSFVVLMGLSAAARADPASERQYGPSGSCGAFGESVGEAVWRWCYANERDSMNPCKASHREWVQQMEASCNAIREQAGCSPSALFAVEWHFHGEGAGERLTVHRAVSRSCDGDTQAQAGAGEAQSGLDRDTRRRIQSALAAAGFDPGQPDGVFGPRTRQAVEGWQGAKGYAVTGELTGEQVEMLLASESIAPDSGAAGDLHGSIAFSQLDGGGYAYAIAWNEQTTDGARQSALQECERQGGGSGCRQAGWFRNACGALAIGDHNGYGTGGGETNAEAEESALSNCRASNRNCRVEVSRCVDGDYKVAALPAVTTLEPSCAGAAEGTECWKELANRPDCYVWDDYFFPDQTVTWSGACAGGVIVGQGMQVWTNKDGKWHEWTGTASNGKRDGRWALRWFDGGSGEGYFVDDKIHGHWVERWADGGGAEGAYVHGEERSPWIYRWADGSRYEGDVMDGQRHGRGTYTYADGDAKTCQWRDGKSIDGTCEWRWAD